MGRFSKFAQIWAKIGSNLRKFWKNRMILLKNWPKIRPIGIWMGHFFLKNWYLYGSTFKFHCGTSLPKPNLSTPLAMAPSMKLFLAVHWRWKIPWGGLGVEIRPRWFSLFLVAWSGRLGHKTAYPNVPKYRKNMCKVKKSEYVDGLQLIKTWFLML